MTLLVLLFLPHLFPKLKITYIAPLLALTALSAPVPKVYRSSLLAGALLDLLSSDTHFGFYSLSSLFATWVVHSQRHSFFADKLWGLALYTALFSIAKTVFEIISLAIFASLPPFDWKGICSECMIMSIVDGFYALIFFTGPLYLAQNFDKYFLRWKHR